MVAELDRFEARFATAYRRYIAEAPVEVDAVAIARQVAAAAPRRHALAGFRPFGLSPALAWTALLAALLAALVGGALLVGSQLQRRLPAVVPPVGQVYECPPGSNPDKPGPVDQARPPHYGVMSFNRRAGRLVVVTNRWSESTEDISQSAETWTFDVCTNTWMQMHPNREPPRLTDNTQLVYDIDSDVSILFSEPWRRMWAYDLQANTWTEKKAPPTDSWPPVFLAYDPVSGLVVGAEYDDLKRMWTYEVEADAWTPIGQRNAGPDYPAVIAFDASVDRIVAYPGGGGPDQTWLFDLRTSTWSTSAAETPAVTGWLALPVIVYDEAAERTLVGGVAAYDATADRWDILPERPFSAPRVYDAVNRRLVDWGMGGNDLPEGRVAALDLETREWIVLLEPTPGQPAP